MKKTDWLEKVSNFHWQIYEFVTQSPQHKKYLELFSKYSPPEPTLAPAPEVGSLKIYEDMGKLVQEIKDMVFNEFGFHLKGTPIWHHPLDEPLDAFYSIKEGNPPVEMSPLNKNELSMPRRKNRISGIEEDVLKDGYSYFILGIDGSYTLNEIRSSLDYRLKRFHSNLNKKPRPKKLQVSLWEVAELHFQKGLSPADITRKLLKEMPPDSLSHVDNPYQTLYQAVDRALKKAEKIKERLDNYYE